MYGYFKEHVFAKFIDLDLHEKSVLLYFNMKSLRRYEIGWEGDKFLKDDIKVSKQLKNFF